MQAAPPGPARAALAGLAGRDFGDRAAAPAARALALRPLWLHYVLFALEGSLLIIILFAANPIRIERMSTADQDREHLP